MITNLILKKEMWAYIADELVNVLSKYVMGYIDFNLQHMWSLIIKQWIFFWDLYGEYQWI